MRPTRRPRAGTSVGVLAVMLSVLLLLSGPASALHVGDQPEPRWVTRGSSVFYDNWWRFAAPEPSAIGGSDWVVEEVSDGVVEITHTATETGTGQEVYNIPQAVGTYRVRSDDRTILEAPGPGLEGAGFWLWIPESLSVGDTVEMLGSTFLVEEASIRDGEAVWVLNAEGEVLVEGEPAEIRSTLIYSQSRRVLLEQIDYIVGDSVFTSSMRALRSAARALPITASELVWTVPVVGALVVGGTLATRRKRQRLDGTPSGGAGTGTGPTGPRRCPECSNRVARRDRYCSTCGLDLDGGT